jgi:hypothetical protein
MEKKPNKFVRGMIIALCSLIIVLIIYNFFLSAPKGDISKELITLLILLIVLVLSEAFDNISLGKILSLNRTVTEKKEEVKELKTEKQNLLNMLISNISVQSQSVGISGHELKEILTVIKADPDRIEEESKEKEEEIQNIKIRPTISKRVDSRKLENYIIKDYIETNNLANFLYNEQVTFSNSFKSVDPITKLTPIFDGYIETDDSEIFIEVRMQRVSVMLRDQLYSRLSSLYHYRRAKDVKAFLQLILVEMPEDAENNRLRNNEKRIREIFEPAIQAGILKVKYIKLNKEISEGLYRE